MSNKKIFKLAVLIFCLFSLSACNKKKDDTAIVPTPTPRLIEIELTSRPYISLIPRADGHELKLKFDQVSSDIKLIEYELIYSATDEGLEIEKGLSGTLDVDSQDSLEKNLLLGTASCTNGCKYKYDSGITGGSLNIIFTTQNNQIAMFKSPFLLSTTADFKTNGMALNEFEIQATPTTNEYFILLQNYNQAYSIFSSGTGDGTIQSISAGFISQDENTITTDYTNE